MSVRYPRNPLTASMDAVSAGNASGMHHAGVASASPIPTARSADFGRMIEEELPLSEEERDERDRLALAMGIVDSRLPTAETQEGNYGTLEEALAAGEPVPAPIVSRANARELIHPQTAREVTMSRLPDFRKIRGIDLERNVVVLDGMEFPITDQQAAGFKQFVVTTAKMSIMEKLNEVMKSLSLPDTAEESNGDKSTVTEVQQVGEGSST